jgi:hypothetical protein
MLSRKTLHIPLLIMAQHVFISDDLDALLVE